LDIEAASTNPPVSDESAEQAADKANAMLESKLKYKSTGKGSKTAETSKNNIAAMIEFAPDDKAGDMDVKVSIDKAKEYISGPLTERLCTPTKDMDAIEDGNGRVLLTAGVGKNGTQIVNAADIAKQITEALKSGDPLNATVEIDTLEFSTVPVKPKDGEHWAEVDLTKQTADFYEGNKIVRACIISSGTSEHKTRVGNFKVWLKVRKQNMEGGSKEDDSYYFTPNVEWISYFDREIAFHYAYWHKNFGKPMSHGCINMNQEDAIFSYDYLQKGDRVIVHY
jgi:lipoprotein-anchoring transpeptidase ErfK/SrfK